MEKDKETQEGVSKPVNLEEPAVASEVPSSQERLPLIQYTPSNPGDDDDEDEEDDDEEPWEEPEDPHPREKRQRLSPGSQDPDYNPTEEVRSQGNISINEVSFTSMNLSLSILSRWVLDVVSVLLLENFS